MKLWTCQLDTKTGEIERYTLDFDESHGSFCAQPEDAYNIGLSTYQEGRFGGVYAESIISQEDADRLVLEKCVELRDMFAKLVLLISLEKTHE